MLDAVQVQDCKNKQIKQSRAFARSYYSPILLHFIFMHQLGMQHNSDE